MHEQAQADQLEDLIHQRKETIDNVVTILADINAITQDMNCELRNQGDNLAHVHTNLEQATRNAGAGNEQLRQAQTKIGSSNGCLLIWLAGVVLLLVLLVYLGL